MTPHRSVRRSRWLLAGLFGLFFAPLALAALWYGFVPGWAPKTVPNGQLIDPPQPLDAFQVASASGPLTLDELRGRWSLVQFVGGECGPACRQRLHATRQVRAALGEDRTRLRRIAVTAAGTATPGLEGLLAAHEHLRVVTNARAFARQFPAERGPASVYVVDPHGNLMMRFGPGITADAMLDDLERLLKVSRIG
jgi:cytochrome oxidase Cu insertion factor (SCO1/SenC/PrrC family)